MVVKHKSAVKPKLKTKSKPAIKLKNKGRSKQNDFTHLSEDIISNVGIGIYIVQQGKFVYVSPLYLKLTGYSKTELIGQNSLDFIYSDDKETVRKKAIKSLKGKSKDNYEYRFIRKNGEVMWVLEMVSSIKYKGEPAALGSFMDITERKQAEESLRLSEEKYRTTLENIEDGYAEMDMHGNFIFFNEALCTIQGYPREELIKMNYRDLMDEENAKKIFSRYNKVYTTGESEKEVPYEIITKNGDRKFLETSITHIKDVTGQIFAFRGFVRDVTERKQKEETIRHSEERYRTILDEMENTYFETDLTGKFTFFNEANCRQLGYSREELLETNSLNTVAEEDRERVYNIYRNIFRTATPVRSISYKIIRKGGITGFAETTAFPLRNQKGEIIGFRGVGRDVTERRQMEETIRQSEDRYRTILESIDNGYCEQDLAGNFTFLNDSMCQIYGYPKEELMGMNYKQHTDKENGKKCFQAYRNIYLTGEPGKVFDFEIIRKDGTKRHIESSVSLQKDSAGKPIAFKGILRDITERKQAEETIRQSEERYRTILDEMADAYFESDLAGNFTFFNDAICRQLGYSREEMMRTNSQNTVVEEDKKRVYKIYENIYRTGKPEKSILYKVLRKDGIPGFAETTAFPLRNQKGEIIGFRGVGRDITERKLLEEALRDDEKRFRELSIIDELTQLYNSRHFYFQLKIELDRSNRYEQPLTLLLLDLDNFKAFNDAYGHVEGDHVLWRLGQVVKRCLRETDFAYRYGGEEFTILLPMTTRADGTVMAERIRAELKKESFSPEAGKDVHMTVSIGIGQFKLQEDMKDFVRRVDQLMYQGKKNGKDMVCSES